MEQKWVLPVGLNNMHCISTRESSLESFWMRVVWLKIGNPTCFFFSPFSPPHTLKKKVITIERGEGCMCYGMGDHWQWDFAEERREGGRKRKERESFRLKKVLLFWKIGHFWQENIRKTLRKQDGSLLDITEFWRSRERRGMFTLWFFGKRAKKFMFSYLCSANQVLDTVLVCERGQLFSLSIFSQSGFRYRAISFHPQTPPAK